jgi:hypothetical protein
MFGDIRLDSVLSRLLFAMTTRLSVVLRKLGDTRAAEICFGRFINNKKVTPDKIVSTLAAQSAVCCTGEHILFITDTTTASFGLNAHRGDIGYVGESAQLSGFNAHPAIAVNALTGAYLALFGLDIWRRPRPVRPVYDPNLSAEALKSAKKAEKALRRHIVYKTAFESKESYRWLSVIQKAVKNCPTAARYTAVGDRESDIYEAMSGFKQSTIDFVIRASKDRSLVDLPPSSDASSVVDEDAPTADEPSSNDRKITKKLYEKLDSCDVVGIYDLDLPKTDKRSKHTARLAVKFCPLTLKCPNAKLKGQYLPELPIFAVQIKEYPETVVNGEKPIHWVLLTSHVVESIEQALQIVQWYRWRWLIEQTFRTLKVKGLDIENSQVETFEALSNLATLALVAAVQVMQLVQARDGETEQNIANVFSPVEIKCLEKLNLKLEGKTQKQKNPHNKDALAFAAWIIARLGGWSGYEKQRPPGPITMRDGLIRFYNIIQGFELNTQNYDVKELV